MYAGRAGRRCHSGRDPLGHDQRRGWHGLVHAQLHHQSPAQPVARAYNVTWTIHSDATGDASVAQTAALTIDAPISVRIPVLMYHNIAATATDYFTVSTADFLSQMRALKAYGYTAVSLQDVLDYRAGVKTPPAKPFLLTFDDAYESVLTIVLPIISDPSINFHAVAFINTANVRPENVPGGYPTDPLSWSEIRTLDASGFVDIESHTVNHLDLTTLDPATLAAELANSKAAIEQQLNLNKQPTDPQKVVNAIAYPFGYYNDAVEMAVWKAGYNEAFQVNDVIEYDRRRQVLARTAPDGREHLDRTRQERLVGLLLEQDRRVRRADSESLDHRHPIPEPDDQGADRHRQCSTRPVGADPRSTCTTPPPPPR